MKPDDPEATFGMATSLMQQHRLDEAQSYLEQTVGLVPEHSPALNELGIVRDLKGDTAGAADYFRKALAADSANADARKNLADELKKTAASVPGSH